MASGLFTTALDVLQSTQARWGSLDATDESAQRLQRRYADLATLLAGSHEVLSQLPPAKLAPLLEGLDDIDDASHRLLRRFKREPGLLESNEGREEVERLVAEVEDFGKRASFKVALFCQNSLSSTVTLPTISSVPAPAISAPAPLPPPVASPSFPSSTSSARSPSSPTKPSAHLDTLSLRADPATGPPAYSPQVFASVTAAIPSSTSSSVKLSSQLGVSFECRVQLFRFKADSKNWQLLGLGRLTLRTELEDDQAVRVFVRDERTGQLLLDHAVYISTPLLPNYYSSKNGVSDRSYLFRVRMEDRYPERTVLAFAFENSLTADAFRQTWEDHRTTLYAFQAENHRRWKAGESKDLVLSPLHDYNHRVRQWDLLPMLPDLPFSPTLSTATLFPPILYIKPCPVCEAEPVLFDPAGAAVRGEEPAHLRCSGCKVCGELVTKDPRRSNVFRKSPWLSDTPGFVKGTPDGLLCREHVDWYDKECSRCGKWISGDVVRCKAVGGLIKTTYHARCAICNECKQPFPKNGPCDEVYCTKACWKKAQSKYK